MKPSPKIFYVWDYSIHFQIQCKGVYLYNAYIKHLAFLIGLSHIANKYVGTIDAQRHPDIAVKNALHFI
jgi:hypothetical protein